MAFLPDERPEVARSLSTRDFDRDEKMPVHAREGVRWAWLIDPAAKTLEIYALEADGRRGEPVIFRGADVVRAAPFDAIELGLSTLWM